MPSLQEFISVVKSKGMASANRYSILFTPPANLTNYSTANLKDTPVLCQAVTMPGVSINADSTRNYSGKVEAPFGRTFGDCTTSFYLTQDLNIRYLFDAWIARVINPITRQSGYYNDYITTLIINVEDYKGNPLYSMKLLEAYPKSVSSFALNASSTTSPLMLDVEWQYKSWLSSAWSGNPNAVYDPSAQGVTPGIVDTDIQTYPIPDPAVLKPL